MRWLTCEKSESHQRVTHLLHEPKLNEAILNGVRDVVDDVGDAKYGEQCLRIKRPRDGSNKLNAI